MVPRNPSHIGPDGRGFFGTVTVGQRGQVALPTQARKHVGLEPGDQLIVLTDPAQGLALIPLASLLERAPKDDPLAMLVRSAVGGQVPSAPVTGAGDPAPASDSSAAPEAGSASEAGVPSNPGAPSPAAETSSEEE